jgi:hypothetical protein
MNGDRTATKPEDATMKRYLAGMALAAGMIMVLMATSASAEDRQQMEDSIFAEEAGNTTAAATPNPVLNMTPDAKTVGFSGQITSAIIDQRSATVDANSLYTYTISDIFLDARLQQNAKVFADVEATYLSQGSLTNVTLQELFLDFNIDQSVYFRTGKQVLQWGTCYLWNPTDLINVEKPHFIPKIGTREGAYGIKMHIPFGTVFNIYSFIDTGNAVDAENTAGALKLEYLIGNLEVALSSWGKKGYHPVWGLDFTYRVLGIDTTGEISVVRGDNQLHAIVEDGQLFLGNDNDRWVPKASLDLSRSFTVGEFKDRLTMILEGYYDRSGFDRNVLADNTDYAYASPVINGATPLMHGTQKQFLLFNQLFQSNYFSRGYVALFTTFNRFLLTDMTLNLNCIQNLVDNSGVVSLGVNYTQLNGFTLGLLGNGYLGGLDTEYGLTAAKYSLQLTLGIAF